MSEHRAFRARLRAAALLLCVLPGLAAAGAASEVYRKVTPSIVKIVTNDGHGSGFFVGDGSLIVTNHHVIKGASTIAIRTSSGIELPVKAIRTVDADRDLAILSVNVKGPSLLLNRSLPEVGETVYSLGSPQGLDNTIADGIVSGIRESNEVTIIQTSAPISRGSSGGPIVNVGGEVVGITTSFRSGGQNLNFAVAAKHVLTLLEMRRIEVSGERLSGQDGTAAAYSKKVHVSVRRILGHDRYEAGIEVEVWNASECALTQVQAETEFIRRPYKNEPIVYRHPYSLALDVGPNEKFTAWIPVVALTGHGEEAPVDRRWYARTAVRDALLDCTLPQVSN